MFGLTEDERKAKKIQQQLDELVKQLEASQDKLMKMFYCKEIAQLATIQNIKIFKKYLELGLRIGHGVLDSSQRFHKRMCDLYRLKCLMYLENKC